ncbi:MAG TPA: hypothetical protein DG048_15675 [Pseudoalteromonas sp.]|jgi:DGQHR domain-containing protein|nr:hypothetical protein [Pseudoalteromonas sp.]|tara:strand:- start:20589 stop:21719 length:1131 start_codon:yes stop_codon:yes gene_type:complete
MRLGLFRGRKKEMKNFTFYGLPTNEGLASAHGLQVINVTTTLGELVDAFPIHESERDEELLQRKLTNSRSDNIKNYLLEREDAIFPQLAGFVSSQAISETVHGMFRKITLSADAQRMLVDGQGRREGGRKAMLECPELAEMTVDLKLIVLNTATLLESANIIRQVFSDYHKNVVKPNSSINLFFDSAKASSAFYVRSLKYLEDCDTAFAKQISRDGANDRFYTLAQYKTFVEKLTGMTSKEMDKTMLDESVSEMWLRVIASFVSHLENEAFEGLFEKSAKADVTAQKKSNLVCCAIGLEALGRVGNLIIDNALAEQVKPDFTILGGLSELNMDREAGIWQNSVILDGKILKGSAAKLSMKMAVHLRLQMSDKFLGI